MSYSEDYIHPFDRESCHDCGEDTCVCLDPDDDQEDWECAYPGRCLMPDPLHHRSECFTVEDAEAYYAEAEGI